MLTAAMVVMETFRAPLSAAGGVGEGELLIAAVLLLLLLIGIRRRK